MPEQRLHSALAPIDVLTRLEMEEVTHKELSNAVRMHYLGVDYKEVNGNGDGAAIVAIPGPESGYAWSLKIASITTLAADIFSLYLGENTIFPPIGNTPTIACVGGFCGVVTFTSNIAVVKDGRSITLATVNGIQQYKILVKQVPAEMVGKL
jgi:hypothetical protein